MAKTVSLKWMNLPIRQQKKFANNSICRGTLISAKRLGIITLSTLGNYWKASMAKCPADWVQHTSNTSKKPNFSRTSPRISDNSDSLEPYR
jgi:hypothetical protein